MNERMEDLYTGKMTIRQIRASLYPSFDMKRAWEGVLALGGPGTILDKNYMVCTSAAFWSCLMTWVQGEMHIVHHSAFHQSMEEYLRKYPLTMLIQDV